jgi:sulfite reductase (ferredoxin)
VVSSIEFDLAAAEREVFEAQVAFDNAETAQAGNLAYQSMLRAAKALVKIEFPDVTDDPERIVREFQTRLYDTQKFFDPFAGGKFAQYFFAAHQEAKTPRTPESVRYLIEEAQLFIEASHSCYSRMATPVKV